MRPILALLGLLALAALLLDSLSAAALGLAAGLPHARAAHAPGAAPMAAPQIIDLTDSELLDHLLRNPGREVRHAS